MERAIIQPSTITVTGSFGRDHEMTRKDFVNQWTNHIREIWKLGNTADDFQRIDKIRDDVFHMAKREFWRLHYLQHKADYVWIVFCNETKIASMCANEETAIALSHEYIRRYDSPAPSFFYCPKNRGHVRMRRYREILGWTLI